jgi:hypothetical protein
MSRNDGSQLLREEVEEAPLIVTYLGDEDLVISRFQYSVMARAWTSGSGPHEID